jgi:argininosuccinate lyase
VIADVSLMRASASTNAHWVLRRFAEEIVIWTSAQFAFVKLSDKFTTGSSIMPQKRNPDAAELVRAKTGRIYGSLVGLLTVMKGLTLAYAKDMQEDKEQTFDAIDSIALVIAATTGMVRDMEPDTRRLKKAAGSGYATATDLADWLVRKLNMPFREAHHVTGRIVGLASARGVDLEKLTLAEMQSVEQRITGEIFAVLGVLNSVKSRVSYGGTAPQNVRAQAKRWLKALK